MGKAGTLKVGGAVASPRKKNRGFTLIEVLVAMSILLILLPIGLRILNVQEIKSSATASKTLMEVNYYQTCLLGEVQFKGSVPDSLPSTYCSEVFPNVSYEKVDDDTAKLTFHFLREADALAFYNKAKKLYDAQIDGSDVVITFSNL